MATLTKTDGQFQVADVPTTRTYDNFYLPDTPTPGYAPQTVFDPSGQGLSHDQFIAEGGKPDMSNVTKGPVPSAGDSTVTDPLTSMNTAISKMLTDAQTGKIGVNANATKGNAQINTAAATSDASSTLNTGAPLAGLSPSQQNAAKGAEGNMFNTAGSNFKDQIDYFNKNITDLESAVSSFGDLADIKLKTSLTPSMLKQYVEGIKSGVVSISSIPEGIRNQVIAGMSPEDWKAAEGAAKKGIIGNSKSGYWQYNEQTGAFDIPVLAPTSSPVPRADRTKYNIPSTVTDDQWNEVQDAVGSQVSAAGGVNDTNRYSLWGAVADSLKGYGLNPTDFDAYLWAMFHPGGIDEYNKQFDPSQVKKKAGSNASDIINNVLKNPRSSSLGNDPKKLAEAIKTVESNGNYGARGGSGEYGAYQFMPGTWKQWAGQYLGNSNAPMTPENQDQVALAKITDWINQGYSAEQVALLWNSGTTTAKKGVNSKGVAYDSGAYAQRVLKALG